MTTPDRTRALFDELANALGITALPAGADGGIRLLAGEAMEVLIYGGDEETILIVAPVGPMPRSPDYGVMLYLFRCNLFSSACAPFQIAADAAGTLIFWGRLWIADLDGASLAGLIDAVAGKVGEIRAELRAVVPETRSAPVATLPS